MDAFDNSDGLPIVQTHTILANCPDALETIGEFGPFFVFYPNDSSPLIVTGPSAMDSLESQRDLEVLWSSTFRMFSFNVSIRNFLSRCSLLVD